MQEVLYRTDSNGRILMVTPSVAALSGYAPEELRGRHVADFCVDKGEHDELLHRYHTDGCVHDYQIRLQHRDGSTVWVSVNSHPYFDARGKMAGVEGTVRDVSTLKQAEGRLQTLALAVENSPAAIIITDSDASIIYVNPAFERISGYSAKEVIGKNPHLQSSGQTPNETYHDMWCTILAGKTWNGEFSNRRKNGEIYYQRTAIAPVRDKHGDIHYFVAVQEDVSELKLNVAALKEARIQADKANAAKSRFLAAASHDLRQPLQAMRLYIDVLAMQLAESKQKKLVARLQAAHSDLGSLLDRLLDISHLDLCELQPKKEAFDLGRMLRDLYEQYHSMAAKAGLDWRVRVPTGSMRVDSDPVFVKEILSNLINNAIRYTKHGGILLGARRRDGKVRVEVWDTGPGIPDESQGDIFQEFTQLNNPERDRNKGIGLGLSISNRMALLIGAHIGLRSTRGRGTLFYFFLPLSVAEGKTVSLQTETSTLDFPGRLIFVVDDDTQVRDGLGMLLRQWQCDVRAFPDGISVLAAMQGGIMPDAVIADYRLHDEASGLDIVKNIRISAGYAIPAVILTGDKDGTPLRAATEAGVPLLYKPVDAAKLKRFLSAYLG